MVQLSSVQGFPSLQSRHVDPLVPQAVESGGSMQAMPFQHPVQQSPSWQIPLRPPSLVQLELSGHTFSTAMQIPLWHVPESPLLVHRVPSASTWLSHSPVAHSSMVQGLASSHGLQVSPLVPHMLMSVPSAHAAPFQHPVQHWPLLQMPGSSFDAQSVSSGQESFWEQLPSMH